MGGGGGSGRGEEGGLGRERERSCSNACQLIKGLSSLRPVRDRSLHGLGYGDTLPRAPLSAD